MFENQLWNRFETLTLDEPPLTSTTDDIIANGRRRLRRNQLAAGGASVLGMSAVAIAAAAVVLPGGGPDGSSVASGATDETSVASGAPDTDPSAAGGADDSSSAADNIVPAPRVHDLSPAELQEAFDTCRAERYVGSAYDGWEPVAGIRIEADVEEERPNTWVIARRGDDYRADCSLTADGHWYGGGGEYGAKSTPGLLYAPVDGQEGEGVGRYVDPVARVTVQYEDGAEREAVLRNGFWFYPYKWDRFRLPPEVADELGMSDGTLTPEDIRAEEQRLVEQGYRPDLIGVPLGYTFRGYDADGELVYDSSTDGPSVKDCYADPTGNEFVGNGADFEDPSQCVRTHRWEPQD